MEEQKNCVHDNSDRIIHLNLSYYYYYDYYYDYYY